MKDQHTILNFNKFKENTAGGIVDSVDDDNVGYVDSTVTVNEYTPFTSILAIQNLTLNHNGNYTCQISNLAGSVEYSAILSVSGLLKYLK